MSRFFDLRGFKESGLKSLKKPHWTQTRQAIPRIYPLLPPISVCVCVCVCACVCVCYRKKLPFTLTFLSLLQLLCQLPLYGLFEIGKVWICEDKNISYHPYSPCFSLASTSIVAKLYPIMSAMLSQKTIFKGMTTPENKKQIVQPLV